MINNLAKKVYENAKSKGFYDDGKANNIGERLCLIHSEVSEALEADRKNRHCVYSVEMLNTCKDDNEFKNLFNDKIKDTFEDEIADVMIWCMDTAAHIGFDLENHIIAKMRYNSMREKMHGKKY